MSLLSTELTARCKSKCEICGAGGKLFPYVVPPKTGNHVDELGMIYMDDETLEWADGSGGDVNVHKDSNGNILLAGDTVVIIKDLDVKGANFTAKRGTSVRRISLVQDNPELIEGRVNDQQIFLLTKFVKKS